MKRSCIFFLSLLFVLSGSADGFHIISWHEPYYEGMSRKNLDNYAADQYGIKQSFYETLSKAGFDVVMGELCPNQGTDNVTGRKIGLEVLNRCQKAGLQLIMSVGMFQNNKTKETGNQYRYSDGKLEMSKQWLTTLAKHPALYGYFITDEPFMHTYSVVKSSLNSNKNFDWVKERVSLYRRCDNTHVFYVNLVSSEATHIAYNKSSPMLLINKMKQYENYVSDFGDLTNVISFDCYPFVYRVAGQPHSGVSLKKDWLPSLEVVRNVSNRQSKPFWGFICITKREGIRPETDIKQLRLQGFVNLVYGAKAIQYFKLKESTNYASDGTGLEKFQKCMMKKDGSIIKSVYKLVSQFNEKELRPMGDFFYPAKIENVDKRDRGFSDAYISNVSGECIVSYFTRNNQRYAAIVNYSYYNNLVVNPNPSKISEVLNHSLEPQNPSETVILTPGDMIIFKLK